MKKHALWSDIFREIWRTKARFISIFAIIMLGVSFFAGVKATGPNMLDTAETFYRELRLMDLKVQTTYGLTKDNIKLLSHVPRVEVIQPGYSADVFTGDKALVLKVYSYSSEKTLNQYDIIKGHLPKHSGEIVLDDRLDGKYRLGDKITFTGNGKDAELSNSFGVLDYTVVGFVRSSQFIEKKNRGTSGIGKGKVDAFAAIPESDFKLPVYTEAYLSFTDTSAVKAYTPEYRALMKQHTKAVEQTLSGVPKARVAEMRVEGERKLAELALPKIYVTDRNDNPGYAEYKDNADRLSAIASAFPVFFFLIAALVSLTTMTRMVEEQRLQIGTLKAIGYSNRDIIAKFLVYGTLASLAASVAGLALGFTLFPTIIYNAYSSLYNLPDIIKRFYPTYSIISILVALICTTLTAWIASRVVLRSNASILMRPKAPKNGQRIVLERLSFIWKRLSFVQKVTARNLFRYKQRMFMTVFGVAGCTALILTGFGLKDSLGSISGRQFGAIMKYDVLVALHADVSPDVVDAHKKLITDESAITGTLEVAQETMTARAKGINDQDVNLFIPVSVDSLAQFVELRDRWSGEGRKLTDKGAIVSEKLAKLYGLEPGDYLNVLDKENETFKIQVAGITENYVMHYVYMTPAYYSSVFGKEPVFNTELLNYTLKDKASEDTFGEKLTDSERVAAVSFSSSLGNAFDDIMKSMNVVTWVLIVSAAALAFVVLYSLTNINVSERFRELSTIKVLGFYDKEVTMYIYRENILLSVIGIVAGSGLGIMLHSFVLKTAELDATLFVPIIKWPSYIYAALLTLLFSGIIMAFMHVKLKRIHMIEALKSVE
ncbi:ABC transporter permease [Paenibacillus sp. NPDC057934]|uniref:ABC transporter permease n=1 Tax=Paenibacillus sp. NPDC057934 TaxID=3346282 RepID=UPI0036D81C84